MKLVDMKKSKAKVKKDQEPKAESGSDSQYPYGLEMRLDNECIEKLGLEELPKVGATVVLKAKATVVSVSQNDRSGSGKQRSAELQITQLGLEVVEVQDDADAGDKIYGKKK